MMSILAVHPAAIGLLLVALIAAVAGLAFAFRRTASPDRALAEARARLDRGDWAGALDAARNVTPGASPEPWHDERRILEGECLVAASEAALRERRFPEALDYYRSAAGRLDLDDADATRRVVEAMLAEARRLSVVDSLGDALPELLAYIRQMQSPCPEAAFWFALVLLRKGDVATASAELESALAATQMRQPDAALYLGALWLRNGQPREALRVLADANRAAPNCPLVSYLLGVALLDSGGDVLLAVRALQKAADALPRYTTTPIAVWAETLPPESWVRNLARRAQARGAEFQCPLGLDRISDILANARLRLAEGYELSGRTAEAAPLFADLVQQTGSTAARRGLGLTLAALQRYDDAIPHLEAAAGDSPRALAALAASLAHSTREPVVNVRKALALITGRAVRGDAGWAKRAGEIFAAALRAGVSIDPSAAADLADTLASADACDADAASVYDLAYQSPSVVTGSGAKLYARAAQRHNVRGVHDLALFDAAFADRAGLHDFFDAREWDFAAVERLYLRRSAEARPGAYPSSPGPDYAATAEAILLGDARREASAGRYDAAIEWADLALTLAPDSPTALDVRAELAYRSGDPSRAAELLHGWHVRQPDDPRPLARLGLLAAVGGRPGDGFALLRQSLQRMRTKARVPIAFAAARLALADGNAAAARAMVDECLVFDSTHAPALLLRAAMMWTAGEFQALASQVERLAELVVEDPPSNYLVGAAAFVAGNRDLAEARAERVGGSDGHHLLAMVKLQRDDAAGAAAEFAKAADGPAHDHASAMRGQLAWKAGDYREALHCWQAVPALARKAWHLSEVLPGTLFLAGVQALHEKKPEEAAKFLRAAAKAGVADPRLEPLIAASSQLVGSAADTGAPTLSRLEQALAASGPQPLVVWRLARTYRQYGRPADALRTLDLRKDDPTLAVERGLLALAQGQLVVAERHFAAAYATNPRDPAAVVNLALTRLSLGRLNDAGELYPLAAKLAPSSPQRRLFERLQALSSPEGQAPAVWTADDDRSMVQFLRSIGRLEAVESLFEALESRQSQSPAVKQAREELIPVRASRRIDRGDPAGAAALLSTAVAAPVVRNLQGIAAAMRQDFATAARYFHAALPPTGDDAAVQQNLAIVRGWLGEREKAAAHWKRFLDSFASQMSRPLTMPDYHSRIRSIVRTGQG